MRTTSVACVVVAICVAGCGEGKDEAPAGPSGGPAPVVLINEVMPVNQGTLADEGGAFPDWIELWNAGPEAVDLSGWWLSDDVDEPFAWQFPEGVWIDRDEYLVVFLDNDEEQGLLHATFRLTGDGGEDIVLFGPNLEGNPIVDGLEDLAPMPPDVSLARFPNGGATVEQDDTPTPAAPND